MMVSRARSSAEPEVGQVGDDGDVEVERAVVYERHDEGGGVDLADGADQEEGVGADGVAGLEAGDAVRAGLALAVAQHANGDAGDGPAGHLLADVGVQVGSHEAGFGCHRGLLCCLLYSRRRECGRS